MRCRILRLLAVCAMHISVCLTYWGEIPELKHIVHLQKQHMDKNSLRLRLSSNSTDEITLEIRVNRLVVTKGAQRHEVTDTHREIHTLNTECHYKGRVVDLSDSHVSLSNCSGLFRGSISYPNETWYLTPDSDNYVLFLDTDLPKQDSVETMDYILESPVSGYHSRQRRADITERRQIIEVVVVTDTRLYRQFNYNITAMEEFALSTIHQVDWIYRQVGMKIALLGMENWITGNKINVSTAASRMLSAFRAYRRSTLLSEFKQHDSSILMTGVDFDGPTVGMAGVGNICQSSCCNVNSNTRSNPKHFGAIISHELGHNLGLIHDKPELYCECPPYEDDCVMSNIITDIPPSLFSDCSKQYLASAEFLSEDHSYCLWNVPDVLYGEPVCGNGFVEEGEECDCGTEEECLSSDPCCEPVGCQLKPGAQCYSGECCDQCKFHHYKKPCRPATSECDLVEYCNGTHAQCPTNQFHQDGTECASGTGYCNYGNCMSRDAHCLVTWGDNVTTSLRTDRCYTQLNTRGTSTGNCGRDSNNQYISCPTADVFCGKLFCDVPDDRDSIISGLKRDSSTISVPNGTQTCVTVKNRYYSSSDTDITLVYDGTKCGDSKWCMSGECVEFTRVGCPSPGGMECGGRGSCNDLNQCHCHAGYDPITNCASLLAVAAWDIIPLVVPVVVVALIIVPLIIVGFLLFRRHNPAAKAVIDRTTRLRFTMRLKSVSRRPPAPPPTREAGAEKTMEKCVVIENKAASSTQQGSDI